MDTFFLIGNLKKILKKHTSGEFYETLYMDTHFVYLLCSVRSSHNCEGGTEEGEAPKHRKKTPKRLPSRERTFEIQRRHDIEVRDRKSMKNYLVVTVKCALITLRLYCACRISSL